jgi:2-dehydro-3-deoxyphosphogalactonate aldolase
MQSDPSAGEPGLIAILRGVVPERVLGVAEVLYAAGFRAIEVPLNSPEPFASIAALAGGVQRDCLVGAGTVLDADDVRRTHAAGGRLVVAPNFDAAVVAEAIRMAMQVLPGIATATEAFAALRAGATQLKLFPAASYGPRHLQALRTVLPKGIDILPVGGVAADQIPDWLAAGAAGFGFGSELFRPDYSRAIPTTTTTGGTS